MSITHQTNKNAQNKCRQHKNLVYYKNTYYGPYISYPLLNAMLPTKKRKQKSSKKGVELKRLYDGKLPIKTAKLKDLLHLPQYLEKKKKRGVFTKAWDLADLKDDDEDSDFIDDPPMDCEEDV
ncbi:hypothetical protein JTE90_008747 [Oedothorax gibbosus]|uniref:Uncharacterized protein n=1 Tax=Oedothorax gibbosus TaxID=931172 RepID=A0AAV6UPU2_9ARAC|nr:hypothetical protein JTE90_008747 [Oedothorax gibbosus]